MRTRSKHTLNYNVIFEIPQKRYEEFHVENLTPWKQGDAES